MKRILKKGFALILSSVFCSSIFALGNANINISLQPETGLLNGTIHEYVFNSKNKNTDNMESRLDWDIENIPYFGIDAEVDLVKFFYLDFYGLFSIPGKSGKMQDYDWTNSITPEWRYDDPEELTHYSCHTNYLNSCFRLNYRFGVNCNIPLDFTLTPFVEYDYSFVYFDGLNGYRKYKSDNFKEKPFTEQDNVISYKQEENAFLLGINIRNTYFQRFIFNTSFALSPNTTELTCLDYHYLNRYLNGNWVGGELYYDNIKNAFQLKADLSAKFAFNKYHSAGLKGSVNYLSVTKGTTKRKKLDTDGNIIDDQWSSVSSNYSGGASRFIWSVSLLYNFSI